MDLQSRLLVEVDGKSSQRPSGAPSFTPPPPLVPPQPCVYILICVMDLPDKGPARFAASEGKKD